MSIWGIHPVRDLLEQSPRAVKEIAVTVESLNRAQEEIVRLAEAHAIPVKPLSDAMLQSGRGRGGEAEPVHQGVMALVVPPAVVSLSDLLEKHAGRTAPPLYIALDNIQDPRNLGAILRSAAAVGVTGVIVPQHRNAPIGGTVCKASAGAAFRLPICQVTNLVNSLNILKEEGVWVFGTAPGAQRSIYQADLCLPLCLVIGGEGKGIRPLVQETCDEMLAIPMQNIESLNASVAAAVCLFEAQRQRLSRQPS